jgi:hypothetical protein
MKLNEGFPAVDTRYFMEHYGWDIVNAKVNKSNIYYACCPEPYPEVKITLNLRRTGRYYSYFYVAPAVLLCFLIPLIFWLPVGCQEKTTIGRSELYLSHLRGVITLNPHHSHKTSLPMFTDSLDLEVCISIHRRYPSLRQPRSA